MLNVAGGTDGRLGGRAGRLRRGGRGARDMGRTTSCRGGAIGEYLPGSCMKRCTGGLVTLVPSEAPWRRAKRGRLVVALADGSRIEGRALVLAQGNQAAAAAAAWRAALPQRLFVNDPWSEDGRAAVVAGRGERRRRADHRHRPDDGRRGAEPRRGAASRADRRAVAARPDAAGPCRPWRGAGDAGRSAAGVGEAAVALAAATRGGGRLARGGR